MYEHKNDEQKIIDIMRYLHYSSYHWENKLTQAENNLLNRPKKDVFAALEYFKVKCQKEMYDRIFSDLSKILYGW